MSDTNFTGSTSFNLTGATSIAVGDYMMIKLTNDKVGTLTSTDTTKPIPNLWFKVQSIVGTLVTVDRTLPNYSAQTASSQIIFYKTNNL